MGEGLRHFVERADSDALEREAATWWETILKEGDRLQEVLNLCGANLGEGGGTKGSHVILSNNLNLYYQRSQGLHRSFLDSVLVPPIGQGVGEAETLLFLDGNHSQVRIDRQPSTIKTIGCSRFPL